MCGLGLMLFPIRKGNREVPILMTALNGLCWQSIDFESNTIQIDHKAVQFSCEGEEQILSKNSMKKPSRRSQRTVCP